MVSCNGKIVTGALLAVKYCLSLAAEPAGRVG